MEKFAKILIFLEKMPLPLSPGPGKEPENPQIIVVLSQRVSTSSIITKISFWARPPWNGNRLDASDFFTEKIEKKSQKTLTFCIFTV